MIQLTKEQTLKHLYLLKKRRKKYKTSTKFKWKCLGCMKDIYVSYESHGRKAIFCQSCFNKVQLKPTIAQYQYMRKLKEQQMKFVDTYVDDFLNKDILNGTTI